MATKTEERNALNQIKGIIEKLGADSYIGWALDGCLEIAEENIENDMACSLKDRWTSAEEKISRLVSERDAIQEELNRTKEWHKSKSDRVDELLEQLENAGTTIIHLQQNLAEYQSKADKMDNEITKLKAKLYDLMLTD